MTAALDGGWVVSSTLRPNFTPGKDPVPILHEAVWAPGPVWTGGKSRLHRDSIPDRPAIVSRYTDWATGPTDIVRWKPEVVCENAPRATVL